jgi:hypothetical protein
MASFITFTSSLKTVKTLAISVDGALGAMLESARGLDRGWALRELNDGRAWGHSREK